MRVFAVGVCFSGGQEDEETSTDCKSRAREKSDTFKQDQIRDSLSNVQASTRISLKSETVPMAIPDQVQALDPLFLSLFQVPLLRKLTAESNKLIEVGNKNFSG